MGAYRQHFICASEGTGNTRDIDIQTDKSGAYAVEKLLPGEIIQPVEERISERIRSYFGSMIINGVKVEIMGDLQKRLPDGSWESPVDVASLRKTVVWNGYEVPVLPLEHEYKAYLLLGRTEKAKLLREFVNDSVRSR